jgi:hypothetical protein
MSGLGSYFTILKKQEKCIALFLLGFILGSFNFLFSNVIINTSSVSITTCSFPSSYSSLGNIIIRETAGTQASYAVGASRTIIFSAPANFEFDGASGSVSFTAGRDITSASISVGVSTFTITISVGGTTNTDILTISGLQVRAINTASSGDITRTGGTATVAGLVNGTVIGSCSSTFNGATITADPSPATICAGSNTSFSVSATGSFLSYQWRENGVNLSNGGVYSGVTTSTLTLTGAGSNLNGKNYNCVVVSALCSSDPVASNTALLTVNSGPSITSQPSASAICPGGNTSFGVAATGTGPLSYQWRENGVNLSNGGVYSGVTTATLTLTGAGSGLNGKNYSCVVSGVCSPSATSNNALLTVNTAPSITSQPSAVSICAGGNATFSVTATGTGLTYQWRENGVNLSNGGVYSGVTTSTLTLTGAGGGLNGKNYDCVISGTCAPSATSNSVTLTVNNNPNPSITPGEATTFCQGGSVTLTSSVANSYLWSTGATTQSIIASSSATYSVTVTDGNGCSGNTSQVVTVNNCYGLNLTNGGYIVLKGTSSSNVYLVADNVGTNALAGNSSGYIITDGEYGKVQWNVRTNVGTYTFPLGKSTTTYLPLVFNITSGGSETGTGMVRVSSWYTANNATWPSGTILCGTTEDNVVDRFWVIDVLNYSANLVADVDFYYSTSEIQTISETDLQVQHWNSSLGTSCKWEFPIGAVNTTSKYVRASGVSDFSPWAMVKKTSPLPVELLYFSATSVENRAVLTEWETASEINNDYFTVERSKDGVLFELSGIVKGAGNSNTSLYYSFTDEKPYSGTSYYRLKQTDFDSQYSYSNRVAVNIEGLEIISIFPNPSKGYIDYMIYSNKAGKISIKILDLLGREIFNRDEAIEAGITKNAFNVSLLSKGVYLFQASSSDMGKTQKQIIIE